MLAQDLTARWEAIRRVNTPIVAAVSGFALGGGCELAMTCDIIVASETAKFGQPEINLGIIPGAGGTQRLAARIGRMRARELIFTGRKVDAPEALAIGLINKVVPKDDLMKRLTGRRTCKKCQQMYNVYFSTSKKDGVCDKCDGELFQRDDDKEETIKKRLDVYEAQTAPLIDYYKKKGMLKSISGTGSIEDIFSKVCAALGLK